VLQAAVKARGWNFCRIDGSMARADARQAEVERFQTAPRGAKGIPVFLLTTQVRTEAPAMLYVCMYV
jgi:SNF2 family DNA or RNA helicase